MVVVVTLRCKQFEQRAKERIWKVIRCILFLIFSTLVSDTSWEFVSSKAPCGLSVIGLLGNHQSPGWICKVVRDGYHEILPTVVEYCIVNEATNMTQLTESHLIFVVGKMCFFFTLVGYTSSQSSVHTPLIFFCKSLI